MKSTEPQFPSRLVPTPREVSLLVLSRRQCDAMSELIDALNAASPNPPTDPVIWRAKVDLLFAAASLVIAPRPLFGRVALKKFKPYWLKGAFWSKETQGAVRLVLPPVDQQKLDEVIAIDGEILVLLEASK